MPRAKALYGGRNLQAIYTHLMEQPRLRRDQMQAVRTTLSHPRHDRISSKEAIMRTETVTRRIGEYMGPVDWDYDFRHHFNNYCCNEGTKDEMCRKAVERFRTLEVGDMVDEGFGNTREVLKIGMYDGWPWWKPVPHYLRNGTLGPEWHSFNEIQSMHKKK